MYQNSGKFTGRGTKRSAFKAACFGSCQKVLEQVARVRDSLFAEWRSRLTPQERVLRLALNEAEALAWETAVPHLVFPLLAEEKVRAVATWNVRQQTLNLGRRVAFAA